MFRIGAVVIVLLLVFFFLTRDDETDVVDEKVKTTVGEADRLTDLAAKKEAEEKAAEVADLAAKKEADKKAVAEKRRKAEAAKKTAEARKAEAEKTKLVAEATKKAEAEKAEDARLAAEVAKVVEDARLAAEVTREAEEEKAATLQLDVDCQAKYNESQAAYEAGNLEANIAIKREILGMGCDEELSSKAQYYIGWTYGNKLFDMDAAQAEYQKGANNYFSGLKYVEKCEEKLAQYDKNDEAEAVYKAGEFAKAAALRQEVGMNKKCDKALAAKNLYQAGHIHQTKLNGNATARTLFEAVVINFSDSKYGDKARQKLGAL